VARGTAGTINHMTAGVSGRAAVVSGPNDRTLADQTTCGSPEVQLTHRSPYRFLPG